MRVPNLLERVADFGNLYHAYLRARRGKRHRACVERFTLELERELLGLRRELLEGTYVPGPLTSFRIRDPKARTIQVAPFRDRVVHHAVIGVIENALDRRFDFDSYASRTGKGVDAALARAVTLSRRAPWVLRSDIEKCYDSIDHDVLEQMLARIFPDGPGLELLRRLIAAGGAQGRGLPIGNLTSQWFANLYLTELDRRVRAEIRPRGYLRYLDDFALFFGSRAEASAARGELNVFLRDRLRLCMNERVTALYRTGYGWPFLGFRVTHRCLEVRRSTWRRFRRGIGRAFHDWQRGVLDAEGLAESAASRIAHMRRAGSSRLRQAALRGGEV